MRWLGDAVWIVPLSGLAFMAVSACGARTSLSDPPERVVETGSSGVTPSGSSGEGQGGAGASGSGSADGGGGLGGTGASGGGAGVGGGAPHHPPISDTGSSFIQAETSVARAPNGLVAVAWIDLAQAGPSAIGYAISKNDGAAFPPPAFALSPGGRDASDPVIAVDAAGSFYLTWVGYFVDTNGTPSDMRVYVAKAPAGSTKFGPPLEISSPPSAGQLRDKPWITITGDGTLVVTYAVIKDQAWELVAARSNDGVNFQESVILGSVNETWNLAFPCASPNGKRIWVTYLEVNAKNQVTVGLTFSDDGAKTWSPLPKNTQVNLPNEPVAYDDPNCVADGNDVWISYGLTKDGFGGEDSAKSYAIRLAHSGDGGATIDARLDVHDPAAAPFFLHPQMTREASGALDFVYYAGAMDEDKSGTYRFSRAAKPSLGVGPSQVIEADVTFVQGRADPRWLGDYTGLFWAENQLYTSYAANGTGASHIAFATVPTL